jgi:hypothetical protein
MKKLFCIVLLMFALGACGPATEGLSGSGAPPTEPVNKAVLVAQGSFNKVFRFQDGTRTCYFTP